MYRPRFRIGDRIIYCGEAPFRRIVPTPGPPPPTNYCRIIQTIVIDKSVPVTGVIHEQDTRFGYGERGAFFTWWALADNPQWAEPSPDGRWCIDDRDEKNWKLFERPSVDELLTSSVESVREEGLRRLELEKNKGFFRRIIDTVKGML